MILPGTLFEELGVDYFGPIDGHDISILIKTLENLKNLKQPRILHIITKKGHGLEEAEENPLKFHGISPPSSWPSPCPVFYVFLLAFHPLLQCRYELVSLRWVNLVRR